MKFLINCDLGETERVDEAVSGFALLPYIDMANIACGGHAGSDEVMIGILKSCKTQNILPGAHPSYPDRHNFGRTTIPATTDDIRQWTAGQIRRLAKHAVEIGIGLHHVKPHGALYHDTMNSAEIAAAFVQGVLDAGFDTAAENTLNTTEESERDSRRDAELRKTQNYPSNTGHDPGSDTTQESPGDNGPDISPDFGQINEKNTSSKTTRSIAIVGQPGSELERAAIRAGFPFLAEAFADRKYLPNGALQSRSIPGSILNTEQAVGQVKSMIEKGEVISTDGPIPIRFDTICVHGDNSAATTILQSINRL